MPACPGGPLQVRVIQVRIDMSDFHANYNIPVFSDYLCFSVFAVPNRVSGSWKQCSHTAAKGSHRLDADS